MCFEYCTQSDETDAIASDIPAAADASTGVPRMTMMKRPESSIPDEDLYSLTAGMYPTNPQNVL